MAETKSSRYYTYIKPLIGNKYVKSSAPHIFSLVTITILIIFAIRPTVSTIVNLEQDIENQQKIYNALKDKENALTEGRNNLQNLGSEKRGKITTAIPDNPDIPSLISSLRNISPPQASVSALQIQPITLLSSPAQDRALLSLGGVAFSYNVQGAYGQLVTTLYNLQRSPRLISISNVSLNKQAEGATILSITGKSFFLKP